MSEDLQLHIPVAVAPTSQPPAVTKPSKMGPKRKQSKTTAVEPDTRANHSEFPQLVAKGLYASEIQGDGNCLFRALSDQFYGDGGKAHGAVRAQIVGYMREHAEDFRVFIECEGEETWDQHLKRMSQDGVFGDHAEIVAFARAADVNVIIYQRTTHFLVTPDEGELDTERDEASVARAIRRRRTLHVAYHEWEHYSSIRKVNGPHTGLPEIEFKLRTSGELSTVPDKKAAKREVASKVQVILQACAFMGTGKGSYKLAEQVLFENGSNVDRAIEAVYEDPDRFMVPEKEQKQEEEEDAEAKLENVVPAEKRKVPRKMTAREKKEKQKREQVERRKQAKVAPSIASSDDGVAPSIVAIPI